MELSDVQFKERVYDYDAGEIRASRPAVIDFVAEWCGSCKGFTPILERAAQKYGGIDFIKVDITKADKLVEALGIQSVPTLMFYKPGIPSPIKTHVGLMNAEQLDAVVLALL